MIYYNVLAPSTSINLSESMPIKRMSREMFLLFCWVLIPYILNIYRIQFQNLSTMKRLTYVPINFVKFLDLLVSTRGYWELGVRGRWLCIRTVCGCNQSKWKDALNRPFGKQQLRTILPTVAAFVSLSLFSSLFLVHFSYTTN